MWIALLSNGEYVSEAEPVSDELSPWQSLLKRLREKNLRIVQMQLKNGAFIAQTIPNAEGYMQAYEQKFALISKKNTLCQGIGSVIGDKVYIIWINNTEMWQDVRPLSEVKMHTTM